RRCEIEKQIGRCDRGDVRPDMEEHDPPIQTPRDFAASTYGRETCSRVAPRTTRVRNATLSTMTKPTAVQYPRPTGEATTITTSSAGMDHMTSTQRIVTESTPPRRYPAQSPSALPSNAAPRATTSGPITAFRVPTIIREKTSRPSWSVPNQCAPLG